eukprot:6207670-Pleurochrysis_carterae.AAC.2
MTLANASFLRLRKARVRAVREKRRIEHARYFMWRLPFKEAEHEIRYACILHLSIWTEGDQQLAGVVRLPQGTSDAT